MAKGMGGLREIRCSVESLPPEASVYTPPGFTIVEVPSGHYVPEGRVTVHPPDLIHLPARALKDVAEGRAVILQGSPTRLRLPRKPTGV
jgi:hypothetical protein